MSKIHSYKDLVVEVYGLTESYPKSELYGLTFQTRKSAISIPSILLKEGGEGVERISGNFIVACGSGAELETQLDIARRLNFGKKLILKVETLLGEVMKMLNKMISNLGS